MRAEQARAAAALASGLEEIRAEQARSGETVRAAVEEASDAERRQMTAFTVRVGEGLAQVSAKLHDSIIQAAEAQREAAAAAGATLEASITRAAERSLERQGHRQEQLLERRLAGLQVAIDALGRVAKDTPSSPGRPGAAQRLRTLEQRLSRVSGELAALEPLPQGR